MSSLQKLPVEVQKSILTSLDYATLCQLRSTSRYFYNFLTEAEIHDVFLNIEIPRGELSATPKDDQKCSFCVVYCDATAAQEDNVKAKLKLAQKEIMSAKEKLAAANKAVTAAQTALNKAKVAVKTTKIQKEKREKRVKVVKAEEQVKSAKEAVRAAHLDIQLAHHAKSIVSTGTPDLARTCHRCKRKHNGYMAPGVLDLNTSTAAARYGVLDKACSRTNHYNHRLGWTRNLEIMQQDGKICKICWKGTRRGASGIQRRRTFIEEFGYWLRETWLMQAEANKTKARMLANESFEEVEKEKVEADAARAVKAITEIKMEPDNEEN